MILCRLLFVMLLSLLVSISRSYRNSYSCRYNSNSYSINVGKSHSSRYPYKVIGKQYSSLKLINDNNFWNSVDNDHYINSNSYSYSKRKKTELYNINTVTSFVLTNFNTIKSNEWYLWTILSLTSTIGLYSEKYRIGSLISSPLVSMGLCLLLCNVNIIPNTSIVYNIILKYFIPIAIPLLLLDADLNKCIKATGSLLKAFLLGSVGTIIGTVVAYLLVPMRKLNGADKIAAALCARHIGGAVNFVAVSEILNVSPEVIAAALAADNLVIALYFSFLFLITAPAKIMESEMVTAKTAIIDNSAATNNGTTSSSSGATNIINNILEGEFVVENSNVVKTTTSSGIETRSEIAKDKTTSTTAPAAPGCPFHSAAEIDGNNGNANKEETVTKPSELEVVKESFEVVVRRKSETVDTNSLSVALSLSLVFVAISNAISAVTGISSMILLSGLTVLGATSFPIFFGKISKAGGVLGVLFMQLFFSVTGALGHIPTVMRIAPTLLVHTSIQIFTHFIFLYVVGKKMKIPLREIVLASNANVGGPTTASAMASNKRWKELVLPALLTGVFGLAIATQIGVVIFALLKRL